MAHWGMPSTGGLRARVRAQLIQEIKDEARRQMAQEGASSLSLRAIARHLDMVSSGIYSYFKSREELLTALIVDAYEAIGSAEEEADGHSERADFAGRWSACCHAVRDWALTHPHEYALTYGSPVPGYHAPEETNPPASRVALALVAVIHDAAGAGELQRPFVAEMSPRLSKTAGAEAARLKATVFDGVSDDAIIRLVAAWMQLFGGGELRGLRSPRRHSRGCRCRLRSIGERHGCLCRHRWLRALRGPKVQSDDHSTDTVILATRPGSHAQGRSAPRWTNSSLQMAAGLRKNTAINQVTTDTDTCAASCSRCVNRGRYGVR